MPLFKASRGEQKRVLMRDNRKKITESYKGLEIVNSRDRHLPEETQHKEEEQRIDTDFAVIASVI